MTSTEQNGPSIKESTVAAATDVNAVPATLPFADKLSVLQEKVLKDLDEELSKARVGTEKKLESVRKNIEAQVSKDLAKKAVDLKWHEHDSSNHHRDVSAEVADAYHQALLKKNQALNALSGGLLAEYVEQNVIGNPAGINMPTDSSRRAIEAVLGNYFKGMAKEQLLAAFEERASIVIAKRNEAAKPGGKPYTQEDQQWDRLLNMAIRAMMQTERYFDDETGVAEKRIYHQRLVEAYGEEEAARIEAMGDAVGESRKKSKSEQGSGDVKRLITVKDQAQTDFITAVTNLAAALDMGGKELINAFGSIKKTEIIEKVARAWDRSNAGRYGVKQADCVNYLTQIGSRSGVTESEVRDFLQQFPDKK